MPLKYIQIEQALYSDDKDQYIGKMVKTLEEAGELIEKGVEYFTEMNGAKLFRIAKHRVS